MPTRWPPIAARFGEIPREGAGVGDWSPTHDESAAASDTDRST